MKPEAELAMEPEMGLAGKLGGWQVVMPTLSRKTWLGIKLAINVVLHRKIHLVMVQPTLGQFRVVVILLGVICQVALCLDAHG